MPGKHLTRNDQDREISPGWFASFTQCMYHLTRTLAISEFLKSFFILFPLGNQLQKQPPFTFFIVTSRGNHARFCPNSHTCFKCPCQAITIHQLLTVADQIEFISLFVRPTYVLHTEYVYNLK